MEEQIFSLITVGDFMFGDVQGFLYNEKEKFNEKVRDEFGKSIDESVFESSINSVHQLEQAYSEAENTMAQVQAMLAEARAMI